MIKSKILASVIGAVVFCTAINVPVYADIKYPDGNNEWESDNNGIHGFGITPIDCDIDSTYTVTIPKTIEIGSNKAVEYTVSVDGDFKIGSYLSVTPGPLELTDKKGKDKVTAIINQSATDFNTDTLSATGTITADNLSAGDWSGTLDFTFNLTEGIAVTYSMLKSASVNLDENGVLTIPDTINYHGKNYKVVAIAWTAFIEYDDLTMQPVLDSNIKKIILPDGIVKIDIAAFESVSATDINIPNSVTYIGEGAFSSSSITSITVPGSVKELDETFADCQSLTSAVLEEGVETIGESAFQECYNLESVVIPSTVKTIGDYAFYTCSKLKSVVIPEGIETIEANTFGGCTALETISLPSTLKSIYGIESDVMKELTLPDNINYICRHAIWCPKLERVTYRGTTYTNLTELTNTLKANGCTVGEDGIYSTVMTQ